MKRDYEDGVKDDIVFFIGDEVEHTPAYGMRTLFVTGIQDVNDIAFRYRVANTFSSALIIVIILKLMKNIKIGKI